MYDVYVRIIYCGKKPDGTPNKKDKRCGQQQSQKLVKTWSNFWPTFDLRLTSRGTDFLFGVELDLGHVTFQLN